MTSTFTTNKSLEKPASGDYVNAWASPVNSDWDAIDASLGGTTGISVNGISTPTITLALSQYRPPNIEFSGTLSANLTYQVPTGVGGYWTVKNATTGNFTLSFGVAAGNSLVLASGRTLVISNGAIVEVATPKPTQGGTYTPAFLSGSVQVAGPDGVPAGYGDFQWGFALPNASGIPSSGTLIGGAGKTQVVEVTDAQIPGLQGITRIRTAGDAGDNTSGGGDLLDFAGASINGLGGQAKWQGGTSVNGQAGPGITRGGDGTGATSIAGDAYLEAGEAPTGGGNVQLLAKIINGIAGVIRHRWNSIFTMDEYSDGSLFLYPLDSAPGGNRGGFGAQGQSLISNGPGQPMSWSGGHSLSSPGYEILPGGTILQWGGITTPSSNVPADFNITFPKVFPTACFGVFACGNRSVAANGQAALGSNFATNITTAGATVTVDSGTAGKPSSWFAIGR